MINTAINGINGKMGKVLSDAIIASADLELVCGFDIFKTENAPCKVYKTFDECETDIDVIIDFSHPSVFNGLIDFAVKRKIPAVIATTGLSENDKSLMAQAAKIIPVFHSANMSLGINLLTDLVKKAAAVLYENFDIEIIEKHHNQKIDAPSGTALMIADAIADELSESVKYTYDRHSQRKKRDKSEIGIHAVRGGTIVGEHEVMFAGKDEIITISHSASSKEIFATGSLRAAKFIYGKAPGLYSMKDIMGE